MTDDHDVELMARIRDVATQLLPRDAFVLVVGEEGMDALGPNGWTVWNLAEAASTSESSSDASDDLRAIVHLEVLRAYGAAFLLVSQPAVWWIARRPTLREHLDRRFPMIIDREDSCLIYSLRRSPGESDTRASVEVLLAEFQSRFNRPPAILDWGTRLPLGRIGDEQAVFSPVVPDAALPYLDGTIDIVMTPDDPVRLDEARRVAAGALVTVASSPSQGSDRDSALSVTWLGDVPSAHALSVSIVIPVVPDSLGTEAHLIALREGLQPNVETEIIYVQGESAGRDDGPWPAEESSGRVTLMRTPQSLALSQACSLGARSARGEILVFLSTQSLPLPGWLRWVISTFRLRPDAGAVGGKIVYPDGRLQQAGGVAGADGSVSLIGNGDSRIGDPSYGHVRPVDFVSLDCFATRRAVYDEQDGLGAADSLDAALDYCRRIAQAGWRIYYQPEIVVVNPVRSTYLETAGAEGPDR